MVVLSLELFLLLSVSFNLNKVIKENLKTIVYTQNKVYGVYSLTIHNVKLNSLNNIKIYWYVLCAIIFVQFF